MKNFDLIEARDLQENIFTMIGTEWFLITPGNERINPMTASWGFAGFMWNKNLMSVAVRPERYTYELMEQSETFTLSFLREEDRPILNLCGSQSGRNVDKLAKTGLVPVATPAGGWIYEQAVRAIECKKIFFQDLNPAGFVDASLPKFYETAGLHRFYFGEILSIYQNRSVS